MYCSKGTPTFNRPQTFNFIAKLNGLDRPPIEAQGGPFNFLSRLKRGAFRGCGRAIDLFNLPIKLKGSGPLWAELGRAGPELGRAGPELGRAGPELGRAGQGWARARLFFFTAALCRYKIEGRRP